MIAEPGTPRMDAATKWIVITCAIIFVILVVP